MVKVIRALRSSLAATLPVSVIVALAYDTSSLRLVYPLGISCYQSIQDLGITLEPRKYLICTQHMSRTRYDDITAVPVPGLDPQTGSPG